MLDMTIRRIRAYHGNVARLQAQRDMRALRVAAAAQSPKGAQQLVDDLQAEATGRPSQRRRVITLDQLAKGYRLHG